MNWMNWTMAFATAVFVVFQIMLAEQRGRSDAMKKMEGTYRAIIENQAGTIESLQQTAAHCTSIIETNKRTIAANERTIAANERTIDTQRQTIAIYKGQHP